MGVDYLTMIELGINTKHHSVMDSSSHCTVDPSAPTIVEFQVLVVSVFTFYDGDSSLNSAEVYEIVSRKYCSKRTNDKEVL